jgi:ribosomal protein L29
MNIKDIRSQTIDQLKSTLLSLKKEFAKMSCQLGLGNTEARKKLRATRKDIARVYTVLKEKEGL